MSNMTSKLKFVEDHLAKYHELKPKIDEERAIRNKKEENNEYIDIKDDFVYYDKACSVVNEMLDELIAVRNFLADNKDKLINAAQKHNAQFFSLDEDILSDLTEKEREHYTDLVEKHNVEDKLQLILENDAMSKVFFEEILPKNLEQDFGITREEYDRVIQESDNNATNEALLLELFEKLLDNENEQAISVTEQLEMSSHGQRMK